MRIVMTQNLANRRAGEPVEIDTGSGEWLIAHDYARDADEEQNDGAQSARTPRKRRAKPIKATATPPAAPRVGDDPPPAGTDTGTS